MAIRLDDLAQLMQELADETATIPFSKLYNFSDLSGERLTTFRSGWAMVSADQRGRVARALVELAEASFEVNFDAIFRHCLDDSSAAVRAAAIGGLWESDSAGLIGRFLTMLRSDPSSEVRAAAAAGLGRYVLAGELEQVEPPVSSRIVVELLTAIHRSREAIEVRRRAIESVAYACSQEVSDALELAYYDDDDQMRLSALVGMGRSCDRCWEPIVLCELESDSPAMRYEAALAAGELGLRSAVPLLSQMLDDEDREVCDAAIWALGQIGGHQARASLLDAFDNGDEDIHSAVSEALAELALSNGELEFALYELDDAPEDDLDVDDLLPLWQSGDDDEDEDETDEGW